MGSLFHIDCFIFITFILNYDTFNFNPIQDGSFRGSSQMSAKMATLSFYKTKIFQNKDYDLIVSVSDVINKILSRDSDHIVDVVM